MPFVTGKPEFTTAFSPAVEERSAVNRLGVALSHLHSFAATFNPEDVVDEESKLDAADLNVILDVLERVHRMAEVAPTP